MNILSLTLILALAVFESALAVPNTLAIITSVEIPDCACELPCNQTLPKTPATNCNQYWECVFVWWWWEPRLKTCDPGLAFNPITTNCEDASSLDCMIGTTTPAPDQDEKPDCNVTLSKTPATNCNQYWECVSNLWWWEPVLKTCDPGLAFNPITTNCEDASSLDCMLGTTTKTTTTPAPNPDGTPDCNVTLSKTPATNCNQYWECVSVWWWWEPRLKTCDPGLAFNPINTNCEDASSLDCMLGTTTPSSVLR